MHKFLRAAGFSMYTKKKDIEKLLDLLERQPSMTRCVQVDEESMSAKCVQKLLRASEFQLSEN